MNASIAQAMLTVRANIIDALDYKTHMGLI